MSGVTAAAAASDLEGAVREANLVSCSTASTEPLVAGAWPKPGAHLFVDEATSNVDHGGDLIDPIRRGVVPRAKVQADLFDLGRPGRRLDRAPDDVTLFKDGGGLFPALSIRDRLRAGVLDA
jgi:ornithine cyclodeaminase/alanine dehydrogenase-like protein (mu-crystallin family)